MKAKFPKLVKINSKVLGLQPNSKPVEDIDEITDDNIQDVLDKLEQLTALTGDSVASKKFHIFNKMIDLFPQIPVEITTDIVYHMDDEQLDDILSALNKGGFMIDYDFYRNDEDGNPVSISKMYLSDKDLFKLLEDEDIED